MNYREAREYTKTIAKFGMVLGLESMLRLLERIGNPQERLKFVHVAGTNGKGSVIAFLSTILQHAGYKTGVYNSPAVFDPLEIYRINGVQMPEETYGRLMEQMKTAMEQIVGEGYPSPTLFELEAAMAFLYFKEQQCDLVVVETGLGGLLDATNCIPAPLCAVLTSISMDHMGVLGNTLEEIATQKAGIIKEGSRVVTSPQEEEVLEVLRQTCERKHVPLTVSEENTVCGWEISLKGRHQIENAATAVEAALQLRQTGLEITDEQIRQGICHAKWQGRLSILCQEPVVIMDGAHNEKAAQVLAEVLRQEYPDKQWCFIMGVLGDKEYHKIVEIMAPYGQKVWTVTPDNPRALAGEKLAEIFRQAGVESDHSNVENAVKKALLWCKSDQNRGILAFGSFTFLKEFKEQITVMKIRINRLIQHPMFLKQMEQLEELEQNRPFCRHGWEHCMDVARCMALLNEERRLGFSNELIYALALVHDMGRVDEYARQIPHQVASVEFAEKVLPECGFTQEEISAIVDAVGNHRGVHPTESVLTALLKEADKKTRPCFRCKAIEECNWPDEKKNMLIEW